MAEQQPITWADLQDRLGALIDDTTGVLTEVEERVLESLSPGTARRRGFVEMRTALRDTLSKLVDLHGAIDSPAPPASLARPLEAVLADIEAEGHEYEIHSPGWAGRPGPCIWSRRRGATWKGGSGEDHRRWVREVEQGESEGDDDVVEAAEKRLAEIRALHAEKAEAMAPVTLEDGPALDALLDAYTDEPKASEPGGEEGR